MRKPLTPKQKESKRLYDIEYHRKRSVKVTPEQKEHKKQYNKEYYKINKENIKQWEIDNRVKRTKLKKLWAKNNPSKKKLSDRKYYENNKDKHNKQIRNKRLTNPLFALITKIGNGIRKSLKSVGTHKDNNTVKIIDCSIEFLKQHLESKFESWMNWENRGLYNGTFDYGWDIDHKKPLCTAKTKEDMLKLWHYTNLQPLCSHINRDIKKCS